MCSGTTARLDLRRKDDREFAAFVEFQLGRVASCGVKNLLVKFGKLSGDNNWSIAQYITHLGQRLGDSVRGFEENRLSSVQMQASVATVFCLLT